MYITHAPAGARARSEVEKSTAKLSPGSRNFRGKRRSLEKDLRGAGAETPPPRAQLRGRPPAITVWALEASRACGRRSHLRSDLPRNWLRAPRHRTKMLSLAFTATSGFSTGMRPAVSASRMSAPSMVRKNARGNLRAPSSILAFIAHGCHIQSAAPTFCSHCLCLSLTAICPSCDDFFRRTSTTSPPRPLTVRTPACLITRASPSSSSTLRPCEARPPRTSLR